MKTHHVLEDPMFPFLQDINTPNLALTSQNIGLLNIGLLNTDCVVDRKNGVGTKTFSFILDLPFDLQLSVRQHLSSSLTGITFLESLTRARDASAGKEKELHHLFHYHNSNFICISSGMCMCTLTSI